MKCGFLLGRFMPPHAGQVALIGSAAALVDELTIMVTARIGDPIGGAIRADWLRDLFPSCKIIVHELSEASGDAAAPDWKEWAAIVRAAHPAPIDFVFAGEADGALLARHLAAFFVPLGGRILGADRNALGGLSGSAIRADWWPYWSWLPGPVRNHYALTVSLHGVESTGKSTLAEQLAGHYSTVVVPEYGRAHCEAHGTDCREEDLLLIGLAQQAEIEAARPWCNRLLVTDTDALMTAAWSQMMIGYVPDQLVCHRKADLYLMLAPDLAFVDDATRVYREPAERDRFDRIARDVLRMTKCNVVEIAGQGEARFEAAVVAIDALVAARRAGGPETYST